MHITKKYMGGSKSYGRYAILDRFVTAEKKMKGHISSRCTESACTVVTPPTDAKISHFLSVISKEVEKKPVIYN